MNAAKLVLFPHFADVMKWIFWGSLSVIFYTYLGYPAWLWLRSHFAPKPTQRGPYVPFVSIIMVARNEAPVLDAKLANLMSLDYPADRRELVIVSDGSTDDTNSILSRFAQQSGMKLIIKPTGQGKASCLSDAFKVAAGEVLVFIDARQYIEHRAIRLLMENFADSQVGCASGELMLGDAASGEAAGGTGLYWKIEKKIREMEAITGSVVGATGALYAVRRDSVVLPPPETILDDVYIPMHVVRKRARVVFDDRVRAWDIAHQGLEREFQRKVRTLTGNYQLLTLAPWLLTGENPILVEFVSHKILRLVIPFAMASALITSIFLPGSIYRFALIVQVVFYGLGAWAWLRPTRGPFARIADAAFTFTMLNTAALVAFKTFIRRDKARWR